MIEKQEPKYGVNADGRIYNRETGSVIPDDEPVFILRARDIHAARVLQYYELLCSVAGHKSVIRKRLSDFADFAINHPDRMREPGSLRDRTQPAAQMMGATKEGEYQRSADMLVDIAEGQGVYFALAFLIDTGYGRDDMKRVLEILESKQRAKK